MSADCITSVANTFRNCRDCGPQLATAFDRPKGGRCRTCEAAYMRRKRRLRLRVPGPSRDCVFKAILRRRKRINDATLAAAELNRHRWSPEDRNLLLDPTISGREAAKRLKRSYMAVLTQRQKLRHHFNLTNPIRQNAVDPKKYFFTPAELASSRMTRPSTTSQTSAA